MNPQIQNLLIPNSEKKDIQVNLKDTCIRRKNPSKRKNPIIKEKAHNNTDEQQVQIQPVKRERNLAQKPPIIIQKKSFTSAKFPTLNVKLDISWLNKFFIYRHESLNKYLNSEEFKSTLDKSQLNYNKQIYQYIRSKQPKNTLSHSFINIGL